MSTNVKQRGIGALAAALALGPLHIFGAGPQAAAWVGPREHTREKHSRKKGPGRIHVNGRSVRADKKVGGFPGAKMIRAALNQRLGVKNP